MSTRQREILRLYRDLLRYSEQLKYTDVNFYLNRIKNEFEKNKMIDDEQEILRQIAVRKSIEMFSKRRNVSSSFRKAKNF